VVTLDRARRKVMFKFGQVLRSREHYARMRRRSEQGDSPL